MARRWIALAVPAIALAAGLFIPPLVSRSVVADDEVVRWTMVDVSEGDRQGDAHLIEFATTTVLIDTGLEDLARSRLLPVLEQRDVSRIDHLFISHAHRDHYGGLIVLADSGVELGTVYFHKPDPAICKREVPWGCDAAEIDRYTSALRERGVRFGDAVNGMAVDVGSTASLTVLYAYDGGPGSPLRNIDVNDTSLIMRLDVGDVSALFTGDLNRKFGTFLASADLELRSRRLLKVPHHGAEGVAPNEFFAAVDPDYAFVPAPRTLWCSERSQRVRGWLSEQDVRTYVNGLHGDVTIELLPGQPVSISTHSRGACEKQQAKRQ